MKYEILKIRKLRKQEYEYEIRNRKNELAIISGKDLITLQVMQNVK